MSWHMGAGCHILKPGAQRRFGIATGTGGSSRQGPRIAEVTASSALGLKPSAGE